MESKVDRAIQGIFRGKQRDFRDQVKEFKAWNFQSDV